LLIINRTVKSERLEKQSQSLTQRPTDGARDFHSVIKESLLKSSAARVKKVRGVGRARISKPRAPAFPNGGVGASAGGLGRLAIRMKTKSHTEASHGKMPHAGRVTK
jgi:hypothetical protein